MVACASVADVATNGEPPLAELPQPTKQGRAAESRTARPWQTHRLSANCDGSPRSQAFRTSRGAPPTGRHPAMQAALADTEPHPRGPSVAARETLEWLIHGHPTTSGSCIAKCSCAGAQYPPKCPTWTKQGSSSSSLWHANKRSHLLIASTRRRSTIRVAWSFGTMSCSKQILPGSCSNAGCGPGS